MKAPLIRRHKSKCLKMIVRDYACLVFVDSLPITMISLALILSEVSSMRHGIPLFKWILNSIREQLVTLKSCVPLLYP